MKIFGWTGFTITFHLKLSIFFTTQASPRNAMKTELVASPGSSVIPGTQWAAASCASAEETAPERPKMRIIKDRVIDHISDIKLIRTDTTLDLSQKAKRAEEKGKEEAP